MKHIILISILMCTVALAADVVLNITVPDAYVADTLMAFNEIAGKTVVVSVIYTPTGESVWKKATFQQKQGGETDKQFVERALRTLGKALISCHKQKVQNDSEKAAHDAIGHVDVNVPDEAMQ